MKKSAKNKKVKAGKIEASKTKKTEAGMILKVMKISKEAELPEYALQSDVGFDLRAAETKNIEPYQQKKVGTGLVIEIPEGHVGLIRDRAGIITKMGVHTVAGTFDPAYRGEVSIVLVNFGEETVMVEKGMRIAQMIVLPITKVKIQDVKELSKTERQDRGFGSTGVKEIIRLQKEMNKEES